MRRVFQRRLRRSREGLNLLADVNAAISINEDADGQRTHTSVRSDLRASQEGPDRAEPESPPADTTDPGQEER